LPGAFVLLWPTFFFVSAFCGFLSIFFAGIFTLDFFAAAFVFLPAVATTLVPLLGEDFTTTFLGASLALLLAADFTTTFLGADLVLLLATDFTTTFLGAGLALLLTADFTTTLPADFVLSLAVNFCTDLTNFFEPCLALVLGKVILLVAISELPALTLGY
jgi:hypothetical protein